MKHLLMSLALISCTTEPENKKDPQKVLEVSNQTACESQPYHLMVSPKPVAWTLYSVRNQGEGEYSTPFPTSWKEGKGLYIPCGDSSVVTNRIVLWD